MCGTFSTSALTSPYSLTVNIPCPPVVTTPEAGAAGNSTEDTLKIPDDQFGPKIMCSEQYRVISINSRFSFPFGNPCLKEFIAGHCFDEGFLVPRIVHYVWFTNHSLDVYTFISVLSAYRFLNPCLILVHADLLPTGVYWRALRLLVPLIVHVQRQPPARVFGKLLGFVQHQADIARLEALREYGGIYLDADQIILKNLDKFRKMEFVMGHESPKNLANSLLISAPHAKFIDVWYQHYRTYSAREWGIHSTFLPFALSRKFPSMITNAGYAFVKPDLPAVGDVWIGHYDWSRNYAIHLYTRSVANWSLFPTQHTLESLVRLNASLGEIARYILFGDKHSCSRCHLNDSECGHYQ
ncbi:uncharacterized protein LOC112560033 isoform X3 [Pomacea canaliculata]|uniref:uncharacterized protein LOC112560033 isoform X3 n=1 Tax=Pomacea canaliculata TaxID=400727 RepID=UPI000D73C529|nr:uncharacterized protein LOC112560033 isoform X3 [Pomacea canaliculata]